MTAASLKFCSALLAGALSIGANAVLAQSANTTPAPSTQASPNSSTNASSAQARRRKARRRARHTQQQSGQQQTQPNAATVGPTAAQRQRDAQILAAQKAQSAASAKENDALTQKVIAGQQKQQAEPRIQDAPGPDSQPLPGNPAIAPPQTTEPARIQDAPGPAQTLPQAPPPQPAPQQ